MGSDVGRSSNSRDAAGTAPANSSTPASDTTTTVTGANACDAGASWGARRDFAFEPSPDGAFAGAMNALIAESDVAPVAVSSHIDPGCVWMVAFSANDASGASHATTFTPMLRHPVGLWTAAPQSSGWIRVVDRASHTVWIPIADVTGSATYGEASCASLSSVRGAATIPASAANLTLVTAEGERSVRDLMGTEPSAHGWSVRFGFSADISR